MLDENTAELIITPDGNINNIAFAEEVVASAPNIRGWQFTALKPEETREDFALRKGDIEVSTDNLFFVANEYWERRDEIDISIVHPELNDENREEITHAVYLYLDNFLGELEFATSIDKLTVMGSREVERPLSPTRELKSYLAKRQSEFVEKYHGFRVNTDDDAFTMMEAEFESGHPLIAVINTTLLMWDRKPSHPWIAGIQFTFSDNDNFGLPGETTYQLLGKIEDEILSEMKDFEGYLNVGRQTANNERIVYFACKDFRKPSKVFDRIQKKYSDRLGIDFDIYKDKYWQSFDRFVPVENSEHVN
jgi:hypothetical protein